MDSLQKSFFGLKSFIGESEVFQTIYILYLRKGVFPLNGNITKQMWLPMNCYANIDRGNPLVTFECLFTRAFSRINMSRDPSNSFLSAKF